MALCACNHSNIPAVVGRVDEPSYDQCGAMVTAIIICTIITLAMSVLVVLHTVLYKLLIFCSTNGVLIHVSFVYMTLSALHSKRVLWNNLLQTFPLLCVYVVH